MTRPQLCMSGLVSISWPTGGANRLLALILQLSQIIVGGGHVYRHYGLPYASPTVGLYFFAEEYIRLLSDLRKHLFSPLRVIKANESRYAAYLHSKKQDEVPIGVLGDEVEIVFLHYKTAEEVIEKWNRRLSRVNMNKIYVKFSEQNLCEKRHIDAFHAMAFPHKVLLLSEPYANAPEGIVVERYAEPGNVINDARYYADFFDLTDWLNGKEFGLL